MLFFIYRTGGFSCYKAPKVCKLIVSGVVIHNICVTNKIPLSEEDEHFFDTEIQPDLEEEEAPNLQVPNNNIRDPRNAIIANL